MKTKYQYIHFEPGPDNPKTKTWFCHNNRDYGAQLGTVKWYGPWRQYCFYPRPATIFNKGCLEDINSFLNQAMEDHKNGNPHT